MTAEEFKPLLDNLDHATLLPLDRHLLDRLLAVWSDANDLMLARPDAFDPELFAAWSGATKDLLLRAGLVFDQDRQEYVFDEAEAARRRGR